METDTWFGRLFRKRYGVWPGGLRCALTVDPDRRLGGGGCRWRSGRLTASTWSSTSTGLTATSAGTDRSQGTMAPCPVDRGASAVAG